MKEIFGQYGGMVIAVSVAILILGMLGSSEVTGGFAKLFLSEKTSEELREASGTGLSGHKLYEEARGITVEYLLDKAVPVGKRMKLMDVLSARNSAGETLEIKVISADNVAFYGDEFEIEQAGIYELVLCGVDKNNTEQMVTVSIPASEEMR